MPRILVIEDDATLRFSIVQILKGAGYECIEAQDGSTGLDVLRQGEKVDALLCDIRTPHLDGLTLLKHVSVEFPDVCVVMMTGHGTISSAIQAMREGAINYLLKPIGKRQLLESVQEAVRLHHERLQKRVLIEQVLHNLQALNLSTPGMDDIFRRRTPPTEETEQAGARFLKIRDLIIDQHRLVAMYRGEVLELTPTEFEILYCLMQAGGRVVTFEEIAQHLRGVALERDEARTMLSSHVTNLRAKLAEAGCRDYLMNSRANGYYINPEV